MNKNKSELEVLILDMHIRNVNESEIVEKLNCSLELVNQYINDFKYLETDVRNRRKECILRQISSDIKIRKLCALHKTCDTCDCKIRKGE